MRLMQVTTGVWVNLERVERIVFVPDAEWPDGRKDSLRFYHTATDYTSYPLEAITETARTTLQALGVSAWML